MHMIEFIGSAPFPMPKDGPSFYGLEEIDSPAAVAFNKESAVKLSWKDLIVATYDGKLMVQGTPFVAKGTKSDPVFENTSAFASAVAGFQKQQGLTVDGKLGPKTLDKISKVYQLTFPEPKVKGWPNVATGALVPTRPPAGVIVPTTSEEPWYKKIPQPVLIGGGALLVLGIIYLLWPKKEG